MDTIDPNKDPQGFMEKAQSLWGEAQTWLELCKMQADWMEGNLPYHPRQFATGLADESCEITDLLVRLNHRGIFTDHSQPGLGKAGAPHAQRAMLEGMCTPDLAKEIFEESVAVDGLVSLFAYPEAPSFEGSPTLAVTTREGKPCTFAGRTSDWEDLREDWFFLNDAPFGAMVRMCQFAIFDAEWGRNDRLWDFMENVTSDYLYEEWRSKLMMEYEDS